MTLSEYDSMDELDKQIEEAKARLKKTQQLAELNTLQQQASAMNKPAGPPPNDPMQRIMRFAMPAGFGLAGLGVVCIMLLGQFVIGLTLGALGAMAIGFRLAFSNARIPFIDDRKKPEDDSKSKPTPEMRIPLLDKPRQNQQESPKQPKQLG